MKFDALFLFLLFFSLGLVLSFLQGYSSRENFTGTFDIELNKKQTNTKDSSQDSSKNSGNNNRHNTYDNYNHYSGSSSQLTNGTTFYSKNGGSVKVSIQSDGKLFLIVTLSKGDKTINFIKSSSKDLEFYGPNGESALVINDYGHNAIKITTSNGTYIYTTNTPSSYHDNHSDYNKNFSTYKDTSLTTYGSTGVIGSNPKTNNEAYSGSSSTTTSSSSKSSPSSSYNYSNSLPQGIPRSQIPRGQENLYILKSEIVPPVCPACPTSAACPREEKCPPCPACARCPEPAFECKKVPNYNSINNGYLPVPVVNDFSTFGM